jgi:hypothetical protein
MESEKKFHDYMMEKVSSIIVAYLALVIHMET